MKTILITGANRGLGLEFTRQLCEQNMRVIATCREPAKAELLQQLAKANEGLSILELDVSDDQSISRLVAELGDQPIDWVINNAGIIGEPGVTVGNIQRDNFLKVFNINCLGALKVSEALLPNLQKSNDKLVIAITSQMGSISSIHFGRAYAYRASKAALNCAMRSFAVDIKDKGVKVMLLHPGWVRTDLGGANAEIDAELSVAGMLTVILINRSVCHAEVMYSYDGTLIDW
ncbi:C signal [Legionella massiliensis]|uniref:C signal n=1 Tax=Legionella massiliensis TaxID=1034943 RepID=A0A078L0X3_9GAMM|nr:SDR family oxidoreductase [Legionella massiliensis]CDZ77698.1 C signal [Legionella massiliensis]CEE13436.1 C-factor [Legionella massiliensis]